MIKPCNILIIGGEGDLAFRKLYPALFNLECQGLLPEGTTIYGIGRGRFTEEEFFKNVKTWIEKSEYTIEVKSDMWELFSARVKQFVGDATSPESLLTLKSELNDNDNVVYLSTPPNIFSKVCKALDDAKLVENTRIVVEKPLGDSKASFEEINQHFQAIFNEDQIYRIDHYLGKETVQNLLALRFANSLFEPLWSRHYIDHVQITAAETVGAGGRWAFYDKAGALRDMVQNHLLQLLCLVSMEPPAKNDSNDVRDEKLKALRCLKPITAENVEALTIRGQYEQGVADDKVAAAYINEEDAQDSESNTETFVAVKAEIENSRWHGVPFYLRTGKRMPIRYSEITIQFKPIAHQVLAGSASLPANRLTIRLQPNEGVELRLINKVPGLSEETELQSVGLDLSFDKAFKDHRSPSAYERMLLDVIRADQTLFMRADELGAAWGWVDGIIEGWEANSQPALKYNAGSWGPVESTVMLSRDGRQWFDYGRNS